MNFLNWLKGLPWKRIGLISLCTILALALIVSIFVTAYVEQKLSLMGRPNQGETKYTQPSTEYIAPTLPSGFTGPTINPTDVTTAPTIQQEDIISSEKHNHIINIMLVGQDRRPGENYRTRSDAMILCTINTETKAIIMTSFMRDLYVTIPGFSANKMNAAYQWGGMETLRQTVQQNFGIYVDGFVEVDLSGFEKAVDVVGGVDIPLNQVEVDYLNQGNGWSLTIGMNHLNGEQALAYSRIRYVGNMDFERTERQRRVLTSILNSCKTMGLVRVDTMLNTLLPMISTDMTNAQIFEYLMIIFPMLSDSSLTSQRIPIDGSYQLTYVGALDVVLPDLEINRQYLRDTLIFN